MKITIAKTIHITKQSHYLLFTFASTVDLNLMKFHEPESAYAQTADLSPDTTPPPSPTPSGSNDQSSFTYTPPSSPKPADNVKVLSIILTNNRI